MDKLIEKLSLTKNNSPDSFPYNISNVQLRSNDVAIGCSLAVRTLGFELTLKKEIKILFLIELGCNYIEIRYIFLNTELCVQVLHWVRIEL